MPQSPRAGPYPHQRRSPRLPFDALVKLLIHHLDNPEQVWCRSTDLSQGGIGVNLTAGDVDPNGHVSLQIPLPAQDAVDLHASLRYRIGQHCGFAFVDLDEDQRSAIRAACDALSNSRFRS